ncbi:MAG: Type 1 glutamine amidotransferase-like domain-containing protein [Patescibacteria group bacterium]|jgi:peptidase E
MIKYILHGGATKIDNKSNQDFNQEIVKDLQEPIKILLVCFAKDKEQWKDAFERHKSYLIKYNLGKNFEFALADENSVRFIDQIKNNHVLYFVGGSDELLQKYLKKINDLGTLFNDKVVVGSSAGANMLAKYYYSTDDNCIKNGLGILPIKVFCHYKNNLKELEELKKYKENLKIYTIYETEYLVIKQIISPCHGQGRSFEC